ncbi:Guanine nucleotide-binding protein alpha-4 subunit [Grifola frondosa]|uniref:Guanine nucleotide-binding protein alpha-4 subunit n=1 Tax=Grifola frondosa TaxID=5627 RepID=A0A1C7MAB0_GRIFR|nr:Guanine nucleotide-binding protein alpha-4 subunit [Grifola frondosa]
MASKPFWSATDNDDPLAQALEPPPDESPDDRAIRLHQQQEAQRVSHEIDESIQESKKAFDRRKKAIKILLLGQAESGKSTTLKNFQLAFSPSHFRNERNAWKTIIQLNLIRSIKRLLEVLQEEWESSVQSAPSASSIAKGKGVAGRAPPAGVRFSTSPLTDSHRRMRMRLSALLPIEEQLTKRLLPEANEKLHDVCVRAGSGWKGVLAAINANSPPSSGKNGAITPPSAMKGGSRPGTSDGRHSDDPTTVLAACKDDIVALWEDPVVRAVLKKHNVRLQDMPGFFLNDAARIATWAYEPSDDDIVRARLRTLGVEEHRFTMESGALPGSEWYIYDVGGSRSNRPHWIPYFDDVQAIIFLAPLAFNLTLEEDPKVNRLFLAFYHRGAEKPTRSSCYSASFHASPVPAAASKFADKHYVQMDILQATLAAGIRVVKYVPSYGDQPNDIQHVTKYFRDKFRGYHTVTKDAAVLLARDVRHRHAVYIRNPCWCPRRHPTCTPSECERHLNDSPTPMHILTHPKHLRRAALILRFTHVSDRTLLCALPPSLNSASRDTIHYVTLTVIGCTIVVVRIRVYHTDRPHRAMAIIAIHRHHLPSTIPVSRSDIVLIAWLCADQTPILLLGIDHLLFTYVFILAIRGWSSDHPVALSRRCTGASACDGWDFVAALITKTEWPQPHASSRSTCQTDSGRCDQQRAPAALSPNFLCRRDQQRCWERAAQMGRTGPGATSHRDDEEGEGVA